MTFGVAGLARGILSMDFLAPTFIYVELSMVSAKDFLLRLKMNACRKLPNVFL